MSDSIVFITLGVAAFCAGLLDAIVGGGGFILLPALLGVFPNAHPATLVGTNKIASICGTSMAAWRFTRRVTLTWQALLPATVAALLCSFLGAEAVTRLPADLFRRLVPVLLGGMALYTFRRKDFGRVSVPIVASANLPLRGALIGAVMGLYDGFFGPGTGSILLFLLIRFLGLDFLHASASAKFVNVATNLAALILFGTKGYLWWQMGLLMALCNVAGSMLGSTLALRHGSDFVRQLFLLVVSLLVCKTGYDALMK